MPEQFVFATSVFVLIASVILLSIILWAIPVRLWVEAISAGVKVGILYLVGMRLRKVNPPAVVRPLIWATKAGLPLAIGDLEAHYLAGGAVDRVVRALISADKANIDLSFQQAAAIDLAGRHRYQRGTGAETADDEAGAPRDHLTVFVDLHGDDRLRDAGLVGA